MWAALVNTALGIWLMAAPAVLGYGDPASMNDRIIGPLAATCAAVAAWEATRSLRWVNLPLGLWQIIAPMVLGYAELPAILNSFAAGTILALLSAVEGKRSRSYAGGWAALWRETSRPAEVPAAEQVSRPGSNTLQNKL